MALVTGSGSGRSDRAAAARHASAVSRSLIAT
jgi:hypothetical protein